MKRLWNNLTPKQLKRITCNIINIIILLYTIKHNDKGVKICQKKF